MQTNEGIVQWMNVFDSEVKEPAIAVVRITKEFMYYSLSLGHDLEQLCSLMWTYWACLNSGRREEAANLEQAGVFEAAPESIEEQASTAGSRRRNKGGARLSRVNARARAGIARPDCGCARASIAVLRDAAIKKAKEDEVSLVFKELKTIQSILGWEWI
jgi:hypothetical protein